MSQSVAGRGLIVSHVLYELAGVSRLVLLDGDDYRAFPFLTVVER